MAAASKSLKGKLLVAQPALSDPNFYQSIVYIMQHDRDGAWGFVMNRPAGICLSDAIGKTEQHHPFYDYIQVFVGGPINRGRLALILFEAYGTKGKIRIETGLSPEILEAHADRRNARIYAFHGHAGWGAGQLEAELRENSWQVQPADAAILNYRVMEGMWPFVISGDQRWRVLLDYLPRESRSN